MSEFLRFFDKTNFVVMLLIVLIGIFLISSASSNSDTAYHFRQAIFLLVSIVGFFLAMKMRSETVFRLAWPAYIALVVVLLMQIVAGRVIAGTRSWLKVGIISIQVSEFIKIPLALMMAQYMARIREIRGKEFMRLLAMIGMPMALIALQPDMGVAFILSSLLLITVMMKRIRIYVVVAILIIVSSGSVLAWNYLLQPYQKKRVISFVNPQKYSQSSGYQIIQSRIAVGSGGLTGKGFKQGSQSQYEFLPTRHTDFIASVLGEEFGFVGISILLLLYFLFFYRQMRFRAESDAQFYFVYLFSGLILFQFTINILMVIGYFPVLGVPLPFLSYGGSSLLSFMVGEGMVFRMKLNPYLNEY